MRKIMIKSVTLAGVSFSQISISHLRKDAKWYAFGQPIRLIKNDLQGVEFDSPQNSYRIKKSLYSLP